MRFKIAIFAVLVGLATATVLQSQQTSAAVTLVGSVKQVAHPDRGGTHVLLQTADEVAEIRLGPQLFLAQN